MWDWLSKIDPNAVVTLVGLAAGLIWHRSSSAGQAANTSGLKSAIQDAFQKLLADPSLWSRARELLEQAAWEAATRLKVPRNSLTEALVAEVVSELLSKLQALIVQHNLQKQWDALFAKLSQLPDAFKPTNSDMPQLNLLQGDNVEIVQPTGNEPTFKPFAPKEK